MDPTQRLRDSLGLLEAIKRRITGVPEPVESPNPIVESVDPKVVDDAPTQVVAPEEPIHTQVNLLDEPEHNEESEDEFSFSTSMLAVNNDETQKLPQLPINHAELAPPQKPQATPIDVTQPVNSTADVTQNVSPTIDDSTTQVIAPLAETQVVADDASSDEIPVELTAEERQARILELAAKRRASRERMLQEIQLENANAQPSDDDDDDDDLEIELASKVITQARTSTKQLEEAEKFLGIRKRARDIRPDFAPVANQAKQSLMAGFDDSDNDDDNMMQSQSRQLELTPNTSPQQPEQSKLALSPREVGSDPITRYLDLVRAFSSAEPPSELELDDSESDSIPSLRKDQELEIKSKFLRRIVGEDSKGNKIPVSVRRLVPTDRKQNINKVILDLRKTTVNQIEEQRKADPNYEILEEIERDEAMMGSLLEQEIERNQAIRRKERARARRRQRAANNDNDEEEAAVSDVSVADSIYSSDNIEESEGEAVDHSSDDESEDDQLQIGSLQSRKDDAFMFETNSANDTDSGLKGIVPKGQTKPLMADHDHKTSEDDDLILSAHDRSAELDAPADANTSILTFSDLNTLEIGIEPTQVDPTQMDVDLEDEEVINPALLKRGRRKIAAAVAAVGAPVETIEEEDDEIDEASRQEMLKQQAEAYKKKIRKQELKERKRRKALERNAGVKEILNNEAVESEDEWQGIGGADGDLLDDVNSEDERMIDDALDLDLNDEEIRKKFMEQYKIKDKEQLERLLDDIKNHRLSKRAAARGLDLEFSDEEDEILMAYRRQKRAEQIARMAANRDQLKKLASDKQHAFFTTIEEPQSVITIDSDENSLTPLDDDDGSQLKRKMIIKEDFVQKQLSFLSAKRDDYTQLNALAKLQHGFIDDDGAIEDISVLKSKCMSHLASQLRKRSIAEVEEGGDTDADDDDDDQFVQLKRPLMVQLFRKTSPDQVIINEGRPTFLGVTVNKQFKAAAGSKASISYMSKQQALAKVSLKLAKQEMIERSVLKLKQNRSNLFTSLGFD